MSFRFLALGDSYTIGERVAENECWPNQLAELIKSSLQFRETEGGAKVTILARTGWTTAELWQGIQTAKLEPPYDLVSLLIGVNNQYRDLALDDYRSEFANLVAQSVKFAGANPQRVIVLSIPDWSVTPFAEGRDRAQIAAEIDAFNAVNREQSARAGVCYVDVTPVSRLAISDPSLLAPDGLHPSGRMYSQWTDLALPEAQAALA
jgi:lysophospholipase L1-like esterase